jgi:hypothetical protein
MPILPIWLQKIRCGCSTPSACRKASEVRFLPNLRAGTAVFKFERG